MEHNECYIEIKTKLLLGHKISVTMAPLAKCPHCGKEVRIDKGHLSTKGDQMNRTWEADCPNCGKLIANSNAPKPYPQEEEKHTAPEDDGSGIEYC